MKAQLLRVLALCAALLPLHVTAQPIDAQTAAPPDTTAASPTESSAQLVEAQPATQPETGAVAPADETAQPDAADGGSSAPLASALADEQSDGGFAAPSPGADTNVDASDDLLSASELAALGVQLDTPEVDTSLRISGFGDFTALVPLKVDSAAATGVNPGGTKYTSFFVGNANLYISKNLSEDFRAMMEVRFTFLPNGSLDVSNLQQSQFNYTFTQVYDYADGGHLEKWGGIIMQRFYLEWHVHPLLTIRAGQFLTPYGIWNVDHGSPTYIPVFRPFAIGNNWFPQRQTGLEAYGRVDVASAWSIGYHLTLSNGSGPFTEYKDLDANKAIGGRLYGVYQGTGYLRLGVSGYYGRDTSSVPSITVGPDGSVLGRENILSQYDSLALAADLQYSVGGLWLQWEWVGQQRRYADDGRPTAASFVGQGWAIDTFSWATYALVGYRLPWLAIMPYVMVQHDREITVLGAVDANIWLFHGGVNLHPIDAVTFKVEVLRAQETHEVIAPYNVLQFQTAWAF